MFNQLPCELKRIIFNYNKLDYSGKCKKELRNFSNKLKFNNILNELTNVFNYYIYTNVIKSVDDINNISIAKLTGYMLYRNSQWILFDLDDNPICSGTISNYDYLNENEYNDVKTKINYFQRLSTLHF